jgi:hypothetical protein
MSNPENPSHDESDHFRAATVPDCSGAHSRTRSFPPRHAPRSSRPRRALRPSAFSTSSAIGLVLRRPADEVSAAIANPATTVEVVSRRGGRRARERAGRSGRHDPRSSSAAPATMIAPATTSATSSAGRLAWLIQRAASRPWCQEAAQKRGEKLDLDPGEFRGQTLLDLARCVSSALA